MEATRATLKTTMLSEETRHTRVHNVRFHTFMARLIHGREEKQNSFGPNQNLQWMKRTFLRFGVTRPLLPPLCYGLNVCAAPHP